MSKKNTLKTAVKNAESLVNRQTVQVMLDRHAAAFARNGIATSVHVVTHSDQMWCNSDFYSISVQLRTPLIDIKISATHEDGKWEVSANPSVSLGDKGADVLRLYSEMFGIASDIVRSMSDAVAK